mgnify:CR=1 FL=1
MQTAFQEKRRTPRHRVFKGALIAFQGRSVNCTVRNMSDGGAGLDIDGSQTVPPSFTLVLESDRVIRRCEMIWRTERRAGVAFA